MTTPAHPDPSVPPAGPREVTAVQLARETIALFNSRAAERAERAAWDAAHGEFSDAQWGREYAADLATARAWVARDNPRRIYARTDAGRYDAMETLDNAVAEVMMRHQLPDEALADFDWHGKGDRGTACAEYAAEGTWACKAANLALADGNEPLAANSASADESHGVAEVPDLSKLPAEPKVPAMDPKSAQDWISNAESPEHETPSVREAQRYADYLPEGVSLSEATREQIAAAIRRGRTDEAGKAPVQSGPGWGRGASRDAEAGAASPALDPGTGFSDAPPISPPANPARPAASRMTTPATRTATQPSRQFRRR